MCISSATGRQKMQNHLLKFPWRRTKNARPNVFGKYSTKTYCNICAIIKTCKWQLTKQEEDLVIISFPVLYKEIMENRHIREELLTIYLYLHHYHRPPGAHSRLFLPVYKIYFIVGPPGLILIILHCHPPGDHSRYTSSSAIQGSFSFISAPTDCCVSLCIFYCDLPKWLLCIQLHLPLKELGFPLNTNYSGKIVEWMLASREKCTNAPTLLVTKQKGNWGQRVTNNSRW